MYTHSNIIKKRATLQKLILLHKEFNHDDRVFHCYSELVDSIDTGGREEPIAMSTDGDSAAAVSQIWLETTSYLLNRKELTVEGWALVSVILSVNLLQ